MNIIYILIGILLLGVLVILHELAHFTLAKLNKVKVEEFAVGMGPLLTSIQGKETLYSIRALPIGGYVRMFGEDEQSKEEGSFSSKSPWRKLSIVAAGPIMNLLVAIVIFAFIGFVSGFATTTITETMENSPAAQVGLQSGDKIIKINDSKISSWDDITTEIILNKNEPLDLTVLRDGEEYTFELTPMYVEKEDRYLIGITPMYEENPNLGEALGQGLKQVNTITKQTFVSLGRMFKGEASKDEVGGPVTIIRVTSMAAKAGFLNLLYLGGFISMSFAIFNILPIPALDGGWIVLFLIQIITRKEIDQKYVTIINKIGFTFLLFLMVAITIKDILFPVKF
ncbi:RIP metalloprotease RseP [Clostridium grantii]|uniref:Zinc metalloprotease n=1 Tax=Clostridium grantii DSM 8605 TaxID=1121316 RepID=A0A1M5QWY1_9CLOT|nr:RIP metalloprotease RseP [Clostridium grantii]SHH18396.1 regulator of sigma E protease [Clostridium grantii DSM 8605]